MENSKTPFITGRDLEKVDEGYRKTYEKFEEMLPTLPKGKNWSGGDFIQYQGFWLPTRSAKGIMLLHDHFKPRPSDIILASSPKSGTHWLNSIIFAILHRNSYGFENHPLLTTPIRDLVPFLEFLLLEGGSTSEVESLPSPRFLDTHVPFPLLPESMTATGTGCRFVYICRNPKDVLISLWHFMKNLAPIAGKPTPLEEAFNLFCQGISLYGPFWDHVLGYWKASLESPNKVLFLKYEDMKKEPRVYVRKLACFLDRPFSVEEENEGMVEKIVKLCSFENLSNLDVNKDVNTERSKNSPITNGDFFRKGQVGDWMNHLTPEMSETLDEIVKEKFQGTGLKFD